MLIMHTTQSEPSRSVEMILHLKSSRHEIEVHFPFTLVSASLEAIREYRFFIALDQDFSFFEVENPGGSVSFILNLKTPPRYSRKLTKAVAASHDQESKHWTAEDLWTRQTDVVAEKMMYDVIDSKPVSLESPDNAINIGRWTTFRITVSQENVQVNACQIFRNALRDFNIPIEKANDMTYGQASELPPSTLWSVLDSRNQSMTDELSRIYLPFSVRYCLEACISQNIFSEYNITENFLKVLSDLPEHKARRLLIRILVGGQPFYNSQEIFERLEFQQPVREFLLPENCSEVYHATVTATTILLHSPTVEMSNRIVRQYWQHADRFLRVRFEDDEYRGATKIYAASNNRMILIFNRVKRALRHGLQIGGRHYEFLAWGNSQLREHGTYFFANVPGGLTASHIRAVMGIFDHETVVAKRAARIGQCFSTTTAIRLRVPQVTHQDLIPDITRGKYTFTDGVGQISTVAAGIVASQLKVSGSVPSLFQFRLGGCKGVLAVSPDLPGVDINIRQSQFKFSSDAADLEIIRTSEFWQACLNRQLILILSALGISDEVFLDKQNHLMKSLERAMEDDESAVKALHDQVDPNRSTLHITSLVRSGFRRTKEPFVNALLHLWRAWSLKHLKEKARLPIEAGTCVLGCVDETKSLRGYYLKADHQTCQTENPSPAEPEDLPEVFVQITDPRIGRIRVIEGICILARNPSLHLGDIRVVRAVDVPALHHLRDVVVMPQTGDRDLPSMCSGGDLDGDDYIVIWDKLLIPETMDAAPFDYEAPCPVQANGMITQEDVITFFHDYMQNDLLGRIAHAHLAWADFLDEGIRSQQCQELVQLHSIAVDYAKTGVAARMPKSLDIQRWPHFMERKKGKYRSTKILGKLYDNVERIAFKPDYQASFDRRILESRKPSEQVLEAAAELKRAYDISMQRIMAQHHIRTEFEVWTSFVLYHSKAASDYKFHEEIGNLSRCLKEQFRTAIMKVVREIKTDLDHFAVAAYMITQHEVEGKLAYAEENGKSISHEWMPFISFPWLLHDILGALANGLSTANIPGLESGSAIDFKHEQVTPILDDPANLGDEAKLACLTVEEEDE